MKQHIALVVLMAIIVAALVWQQTAVAPEVHEGVAETSTSTVPDGDEALPPVSTDAGALPPSVNTPSETEGVACTMDAKECPDGSYVGRVAPDCAFAACPSDSSTTSDIVTCTPAMKAAEVCPAIYAPVCGLVQVQCVTTPCDPIRETFSSGCSACAQENVLSYTEGTCGAE